VERIAPGRELPVKARQANGVPECKQMLKAIIEGTNDANFLEGMGCVGGCVGGPRIIIDKDEGTKNVNEYAARTEEKTPLDNPFVFEMLRRLGFDSTESLLREQNMFMRDFDKRR
jgi:iron only hydrogenase large subunit-like protein